MRKIFAFLSVFLLVVPYAEAQVSRTRVRINQRVGGFGGFGGFGGARSSFAFNQRTRGFGGFGGFNNFGGFNSGFNSLNLSSGFGGYGGGFNSLNLNSGFGGYGGSNALLLSQFNHVSTPDIGRLGYGLNLSARDVFVANQLTSYRQRSALDSLNTYSDSCVRPAQINVIADQPAHYCDVPVVQRTVIQQAPPQIIERVVIQQQAPVVTQQTTTTTTTTAPPVIPNEQSYYRATATPQAGPTCNH